MFPTSSLPVAPVAIPSGIGAILVVVALGGGLGLLVASIVRRREHRATIAVAADDEAKPTTRLSA